MGGIFSVTLLSICALKFGMMSKASESGNYSASGNYSESGNVSESGNLLENVEAFESGNAEVNVNINNVNGDSYEENMALTDITDEVNGDKESGGSKSKATVKMDDIVLETLDDAKSNMKKKYSSYSNVSITSVKAGKILGVYNYSQSYANEHYYQYADFKVNGTCAEVAAENLCEYYNRKGYGVTTSKGQTIFNKMK